MDKLILINKQFKNKLINKRIGESKFGEHVQILPNITPIYEQLKNLDVKYVIFGIPEDIGVFGNHGKGGSSKAWDATLNALLNIQSNAYTNPKSVLLLGHLDFSEELDRVSQLNPSKKKHIKIARSIVENIDNHVTNLVYQIVRAGKIPIIIGGGHNNAYGNIKGTSLGLNKAINAINFDAHSDFRPEEGRHSGNGFSYAYAEGFLEKYFVFGLHENYTSAKLFESLKKFKFIRFNTFESIEIRKELKFKAEMNRALNFVSENSFGIEIDCDAIQNIPSSAATPSGFSVNKTRTFLTYFAQHVNASYLHICEAAPTKRTNTQIGKLISYFITDFIRAHDN
ncbi:formimidoylglutamase [Aestuariivivens sediminicola]|uniref:formimidoylglutamase n=1 Tax=Aestuariivivens sediminicola TaxID=2913560 RepID=UPI001F56B124|nr:formimidoylglutamase [Aestuariivivens sediminicola]